MLKINDMLDLTLEKTHTGWTLIMPDRNLLELRKMVKENSDFSYSGKVVQYLVKNIDKAIGKQGTSQQWLRVPKELVAKWIVNEDI